MVVSIHNAGEFLSIPTWNQLLLGALSISILVLWSSGALDIRRRRMPPGPRGLPLVGNKHQVPSIKPWRMFKKWNEQYGPVVSLHLGRTPVIVLGTARAAWEILDKRSDIYSSRPRFVVAGEILSDNRRGLMLPYGEEWRKYRKVLHSGLHARRAETYKDMQSLESKATLRDILLHPEAWDANIQRYAASVAVSLSYGKRVHSMDEWIVRENVAAMDYIDSIPGKYLVESWPWLLKLPRFLQWFRREPEEYKQRDIKLYTSLIDDVKNRMAEGKCPDCLTSQTLSDEGFAPGSENKRKNEKVRFDELDVAYTVASPFGAGIETVSGVVFSINLKADAQSLVDGRKFSVVHA
ncbi:hypothetical protein QCA50_013117 [Cerrena zonata]|uniref:Cytochrome P450 n=1 Tax=Cerrena zonata TaxID=2478898 RepID=A0AAW0FSC4_9APHY